MNSKIFEESHNYLLVFVNFYPSSPPPQVFLVSSERHIHRTTSPKSFRQWICQKHSDYGDYYKEESHSQSTHLELFYITYYLFQKYILYLVFARFPAFLDLTEMLKCKSRVSFLQPTHIFSRKRGFVISRYLFIDFLVTGAKNISQTSLYRCSS